MLVGMLFQIIQYRTVIIRIVFTSILQIIVILATYGRKREQYSPKPNQNFFK